MGDTDRDPASDTPPNPAPAPDSDPERTVVVPGRATPPPAADPDVTGDYRVDEETTMVVPPRTPAADAEKTQLASRPTAPPASPQSGGWASSPMTPPPPAATAVPVPQGATPGPVPQGATQHWPQSPMTPAPMGYPQFPPGARPPGRRRTLLIAGAAAVAVVVAVVLITGLWVPGYFNTDTLDVKAADAGVQQVLTDPATGYGLPKVSDVACNNGQNPTISDGGTFTCSVSIAGSRRQVTVRFVGKDGTYAVGRPE